MFDLTRLWTFVYPLHERVGNNQEERQFDRRFRYFYQMIKSGDPWAKVLPPHQLDPDRYADACRDVVALFVSNGLFCKKYCQKLFESDHRAYTVLALRAFVTNP